MEKTYFGMHNHTEYSNARLLDAINKVEDLIEYAHDIGLSGIAITDHETLSAHIRALKFYKGKCDKDPEWKNFKLALGNEIYLCRNDMNGENFVPRVDKFPHFILIAKDPEGHKQLRELSTRAWSHSFNWFMTRVPTYYKDIEEVIGNNPGHIIASSACIGSQLGIDLQEGNLEDADKFIKWCKGIFGDDYYLEIQPARYEEQITYNKWLIEKGEELGIKVVITTDAHYLNKDLREVHSAFLNSKEGDRETADFYQYTYVMAPDEVKELTEDYISEEKLYEIFNNTLEVQNKIEDYDLAMPQIVPKIIDDRDKVDWKSWLARVKIQDKYEYLNKYLVSDYEDDRYFLYLALHRLLELNLTPEDKEKYLDRLEGEAAELWLVSEQIKQPLSAYLLTVRNIVHLIWYDTNSIVGVSRGSAGSLLFNYLIGVIDMNPLTCGLFLDYRRFVHREKPELSDIDVDSEGCRRNLIIKTLDDVMRSQNGRSLNVATFGTLGARSAILTVARGMGIDNDEAQYMASMIGQERGFSYSIKDCVYGNEEKGRRPVKELIDEMNKYPNFLEACLALEGLVCQVGIHASGVCLYNTDIWDYSCSMKAPNGMEITQWDLHDAEYAGSLKFDLLSVEAADKIHNCIDLLVADGLMEWQGDLRSTYLKYLHPNVLEYTDSHMWDLIAKNKIIDLFQMDTTVAKQSLKAIKPTSVPELAAVNSLMRLMPDKGEATPVEEYVEYKKHPDKLRQEIDALEGSEEQKKILYDFLEEYNGVPSSQESVMYLSMIPELTDFTFGMANKLRKLISKKQMDKIAEFREIFFARGAEKGVSEDILSFEWDKQIKRQLGYSFSDIHTIAYSLIALQEMNLNLSYPYIYWATACLTVNSGAAVEEGGTTNYGKVSSAIGRIKNEGIDVELPDINKARLSFSPNREDNTILYGLKGLSGVGNDLITKIIENRPYTSFEDFMTKIEPTRSEAIALIKAGCFDKMVEGRKELLYNYIDKLVDRKSKITLANMNGLINYKVLPRTQNKYIYLFNFNKYLKLSKKDDRYYLDDRAYQYFSKNFDTDILENEKGKTFIRVNVWEKLYKDGMEGIKEYFSKNQDKLIDKLHEAEVQEQWADVGLDSLADWEMDTLGFYYHEHPLKGAFHPEFKFKNFFDLPETPIPAHINEYKGRKIPVYDIEHIVGTVLDKNAYKHTVVLLTPDGVVNVKCMAEQFSKYDKQISQLNKETGKKQVIEKSWFKRGTKLIVSGYRRGDTFVVRSKQSDNIYPFYHILGMGDTGLLEISRYRADD